jgi:hypothetical protein
MLNVKLFSKILKASLVIMEIVSRVFAMGETVP